MNNKLENTVKEAVVNQHEVGLLFQLLPAITEKTHEDIQNFRYHVRDLNHELPAYKC